MREIVTSDDSKEQRGMAKKRGRNIKGRSKEENRGSRIRNSKARFFIEQNHAKTTIHSINEPNLKLGSRLMK